MSWFREMFALWREYRQADREYKAFIAKINADIDRKYAEWYRTMREADAFLNEEYDRVHIDLGNGDIALLDRPLEFWEAYVECRGFTGKATAAEMKRVRGHIAYLRGTELRT